MTPRLGLVVNRYIDFPLRYVTSVPTTVIVSLHLFPAFLLIQTSLLLTPSSLFLFLAESKRK